MVDVTVRGAGIFGLSIAWACAQRGASVQVIDPHGVGAGSSGGIVGALAPHTPERWNPKKAFQFDSLIMAQDWWAAVSDASGLPTGYLRSGRVQPIADANALALAQARAREAQDLWQGKAAWRIEDAQGAWCPQSPTGKVIHDTLSARLHPRMACRALAQAMGDVAPDGADRGFVVHATGWQGLLDLSARFDRSMGAGVKGQSALLGFHAPDAPQLFADTLHIVPHADGTVAIGSTSERDFDAPDTCDRQLDDVIARALSAFPVLQDAPVIERWAGVRPRARSRAPMLGPWPGRPGHFIANGGFKIGFGMAPKVAHVMADLILEGIDAIPEGFRVEDNL